MDREILFRGKRLDNGEWVEGCLVNNVFFFRETKSGVPHIIPTHHEPEFDCWETLAEWMNDFEVDPATVGQYTGLKDSDGVKIFEGDIFKGGEVPCTGGFKVINGITTVKFGSGIFKAGTISLCSIHHRGRVIGNIHDSPELLGVTGKSPHTVIIDDPQGESSE